MSMTENEKRQQRRQKRRTTPGGQQAKSFNQQRCGWTGTAPTASLKKECKYFFIPDNVRPRREARLFFCASSWEAHPPWR